MEVRRYHSKISTSGKDDIIDLSAHCTDAIHSSEVHEGVLIVFTSHSTCAVTTMEFEPGAVQDLKDWLGSNVPAAGRYQHNILNHDTNGHAHLRCAILGPSISIPICDGAPSLGTWQTPVLIDCDDRPRVRDVILQVIGD